MDVAPFRLVLAGSPTGAIAVVRVLKESAAGEMRQNAIAKVEVDQCVPIDETTETITLVGSEVAEHRAANGFEGVGN